ncbi:ABC transporter permease, partial [Bacillus thuringiensis]|uniref:ABC transporter permease n=1 Tax=Bacillus thuringiensis TaxID=1428 RepID=UPI000E310932
MNKTLKITLTGLLATTLLVGCGSKEEPKKEHLKQEAKQESKKDNKKDNKKDTKSDAEKVAIAEKFHPVVYPHKEDGTIDKLSVMMTKKEKVELYNYVEKKAKAEGMTPEEYSKVKGEENAQRAREQTQAQQEQKAQETQTKTQTKTNLN